MKNKGKIRKLQEERRFEKKSEKVLPSFSHVGSVELTKNEAEVLYFLTVEGISIHNIALRRQTSRRAVDYIVKSLKKKGVLTRTFSNLLKKGCTPQNLRRFRLHGQEFHIGILYKDNRYKELLEKGNIVYKDGWTVRLYRDSLEVYCSLSFFGDSIDKITGESVEALHRFLVSLEHDFKLILIKPRVMNIRQVKAHYAEINNEMAKEVENQGERVSIKTTDDGKLWFLIDNSFNLHEAETVHPQTSKADMKEVIAPFLNDLRDSKPPLPSEMWKLLGEVVKAQHTQALQMQVFLDLMMPKKSEKKEEADDEPLGWYIG